MRAAVSGETRDPDIQGAKSTVRANARRATMAKSRSLGTTDQKVVYTHRGQRAAHQETTQSGADETVAGAVFTAS